MWDEDFFVCEGAFMPTQEQGSLSRDQDMRDTCEYKRA